MQSNKNKYAIMIRKKNEEIKRIKAQMQELGNSKPPTGPRDLSRRSYQSNKKTPVKSSKLRDSTPQPGSKFETNTEPSSKRKRQADQLPPKTTSAKPVPRDVIVRKRSS